MMRLRILSIILLLSITTFGQSSYNRLGYGELYPTSDPRAASLGEGVIALQDSNRANYYNPALLNGLNRVYFNASAGSDFRTSDGSTINTTRLDHIDFIAPLGRKMGFSVSINSIADFESEHAAALADGALNEISSGGIWDYSLGLGYRLNPKIGLGVKYHLLHGFVRRVTSLNSESLNEYFLVKGNINGHGLELGAVADIGQNVVMGLTLDLPVQRPMLAGVDSLAGSSQSSSFEEELAAWPTTIKLGFVVKPSKRTRYVAGITQKVFPSDGFDSAAIFKLPAGWQPVPGRYRKSLAR